MKDIGTFEMVDRFFSLLSVYCRHSFCLCCCVQETDLKDGSKIKKRLRLSKINIGRSFYSEKVNEMYFVLGVL